MCVLLLPVLDLSTTTVVWRRLPLYDVLRLLAGGDTRKAMRNHSTITTTNSSRQLPTNSHDNFVSPSSLGAALKWTEC
jgi:hypothetical protein